MQHPFHCPSNFSQWESLNMDTNNSVMIGLIAIICIFGPSSGQLLKVGFYSKTCPKAEEIVLDVAKKHIPLAPELAASLIRMHFHDCFVRGCDGSVLLNSTNGRGERDAVPNQTLRGFSLIEKAKVAVEKQCPGVVSCADILALIARDAHLVAHGRPKWNVPMGRRDGRISNSSEALANLPSPTFNFSQLSLSFANKGLNNKDLVLLSGAHTVGIAHCGPSISNRLYNFSGKGESDPSMDKKYVAKLKKNKCKSISDNTSIVEMDTGSFRTFDLSYYQTVKERRGLFQSDAALLTDPASKSYIQNQLLKSKNEFFIQFAKSMEKMGQIGVLTGTAGEIRKHCSLLN